MKSYQTRTRKRRISIIALLVITAVVVGGGLYLLIPCQEEIADTPTDFPAATKLPVSAATQIMSTPTPYPSGDQWDLAAGSLAEWQLGIVLNDLQEFWAAYMSPEGLIDCRAAIDLVAKASPAAEEGILAECAMVQENGLFETNLPLSRLKVTEVQLAPEKGYIALQLDTTKDWPAQVRYLADNGLKNVVPMSRVVYNVVLIFEEGMWRLVSLQRFVAGEDF